MIRLAPALRLQFVAWPAALTWPWIVLVSSLVVNIGIFATVVPDSDDGTTGGLLSIYICTAILYVMTMTQMFPFGLGLSLTRRAIYAAATVMAAVQALASGIVLYLLKVIEAASNGWGIDLKFFGLPFLTVDNPLLQILVYSGPFLLMAAIGAVIGAIYKRWGQNGLWTLGVGGLVVFGGLVVLINWQHWWIPIGHWFAAQSPMALYVGYCPLLAVILGGFGYLILRRTTV